MNNFLIGCLFLSAAFGGAFYAGRIKQKEMVKEEETTSNTSFLPSPYPLLKHSFVVVVIGHNNGASVERTIDSIFSQTHESYRVIYIDDASNDGSFELARDLIYQTGDLSRVTIVRNEEKLGHLANVVRAVQTCEDDEIVVIVGGDDWLSHEWVLARLNQYYANPDLWMTYGHYLEYPHYSPGNSREVKVAGVRQDPFTATHLKSFYAALFKQIPEREFTYQGNYYAAAGEMAYMFPMLEMAADHSAHVNEVLYIVNRMAPVRDDRDLSARCEKAIRSLSAFAPLLTLQTEPVGAVE